MRQVARTTALAALLAAAFACQPVGHEQGQVGLSVQFPSPFQVKVIPETTTRIEVAVSGEGMTGALTSTLTRANPKLLVSVPEGPKTVSAKAVDAAGKTVALGSASVTVIARTKVQAIVSLAPAPDASPSPTPPAVDESGNPVNPPPDGTTSSPPPSPTPGPTPTPAPTPTSEPTPTSPLTPGGAGGGGALATPTPTPVATVSAQIIVVPPNAGPGHRDL